MDFRSRGSSDLVASHKARWKKPSMLFERSTSFPISLCFHPNAVWSPFRGKMNPDCRMWLSMSLVRVRSHTASVRSYQSTGKIGSRDSFVQYRNRYLARPNKTLDHFEYCPILKKANHAFGEKINSSKVTWNWSTVAPTRYTPAASNWIQSIQEREDNVECWCRLGYGPECTQCMEIDGMQPCFKSIRSVKLIDKSLENLNASRHTGSLQNVTWYDHKWLIQNRIASSIFSFHAW